MKDEYKVLIVLGVIVCIIFGSIFVYDAGSQSKTGKGGGFFGLFGEDTYTLTVTTDPNLCEVYLNGMYKNSLYDGQAVFRNINRGTYTLVVKRGDYSSVTQTITMDSRKEIFVSLEQEYIPPPVNTPPVVYTPEPMDEIGAIRETYEFYVDGYDADGDSLRYRIEWGDGTKSTWSSATFLSHSWNKPGRYEIKAKAYDGIDYSEWSSPLYFTVKKEINAAPTVVLYGPASGNIGSPGISYTFMAYGYDAEGASLRYKFDWGDGTSTRWAINRMVEKTYYSAGIFTVKVQAYDGKIYSDYATLTFQVGIGRLPAPTITAYDCEKGRTNMVVIRVITTLDKDVFDLYGFVKDTSGIIIKWTALRKSFSGDGYIATMSFTCNVLGDVTISAKAGPTRGVSGYLSSDVVTKTIQCVITPEEREEEKEEVEEEPPYAPPEEYRYREVPGFELIIFFIAAIVVVMLYKKKRMDGS